MLATPLSCLFTNPSRPCVPHANLDARLSLTFSALDPTALFRYSWSLISRVIVSSLLSRYRILERLPYRLQGYSYESVSSPFSLRSMNSNSFKVFKKRKWESYHHDQAEGNADSRQTETVYQDKISRSF